MPAVAKVQRIYDSVRNQVANPVKQNWLVVDLPECDWAVVLALLTQELGVQSLEAVGLRGRDAERR